MAIDNSAISSGFTPYPKSGSVRLLVPISTAAQIEEEAIRAKSKIIDEKIVQEMADKIVSDLRPHKKNRKAGPMDVEIFTETAIDNLIEIYEGMDSTSQYAGKAVHKGLTNSGNRFRTIPRVNRSAVKKMLSSFENMAEPLNHILGELELMAHIPKNEFRITPVLLLGGPGIGKTAFANALAKVMNLPFCKIKGSEPSFCLTGSHVSWNKAAPGLLIKQLALHSSASPVFLVDEMEKGGEDKFPMSNALLDLLEPENARNFKDEFFQMEFNANHVIWILTANSVAEVSAPLLSRLSVFNISSPNVAQRKRIIKHDLARMREKTGKNIRVASMDVSSLADRVDLDLRDVGRIVRNGFIKALLEKLNYVQWDLPSRGKVAMGFL